MLKLIVLCFSLLVSFSETVIKNKDNLGSIQENETNLVLELKYIVLK